MSYYDTYYKSIEKAVGKTVKSVAVYDTDDTVNIVSFRFTDDTFLEIHPSEWIAYIKFVDPKEEQ